MSKDACVTSVKGMSDVLPKDSFLWQSVEQTLQNTLIAHGYQQVRMPLLEKTEVFCRAIGEVTDIVEKEMYSFNDKGKDSLSLRPEGTASCVRMMIEHNLPREGEQKVYYLGPMFRRERPQKGRYRQFHQVGVEVYGCSGVKSDVELIAITQEFWQKLGLKNLSLEINSLGSIDDRKRYKDVLIEYLNENKSQLDDDSLRRLNKNPLRILDSKNPKMSDLLNNAPKLLDFLTGDSKKHFEQLTYLLENLNIDYKINTRLVRGLDYYNDTVFEWTTEELGSQGTICAGGRYDSLVKQMGGQETPAVGFALGLERLLLLLEAQNIKPENKIKKLYCVAIGTDAELKSFEVVNELRQKIPNLIVINDISQGNFKKQLKKADKSLADYAIIIAEDEMKSNKITLKFLRSREEQQSLSMSELITFLQP
jgi:histidyl-tRNA synthetase